MWALLISAPLWLWSQRFAANPVCVFLSYNTSAPQTHYIKYETVARGWEGTRYSQPRKESSGWQPASPKPTSPLTGRFVFSESSRVARLSDYKATGLCPKINGCVPAVMAAAPQDDVRTLMSVGHQLWWNNLTFHEIILSGLMSKPAVIFEINLGWTHFRKCFSKTYKMSVKYQRYYSLGIKKTTCQSAKQDFIYY